MPRYTRHKTRRHCYSWRIKRVLLGTSKIIVPLKCSTLTRKYFAVIKKLRHEIKSFRVNDSRLCS